MPHGASPLTDSGQRSHNATATRTSSYTSPPYRCQPTGSLAPTPRRREPGTTKAGGQHARRARGQADHHLEPPTAPSASRRRPPHANPVPRVSPMCTETRLWKLGISAVLSSARRRARADGLKALRLQWEGLAPWPLAVGSALPPDDSTGGSGDGGLPHGPRAEPEGFGGGAERDGEPEPPEQSCERPSDACHDLPLSVAP